MARTRGVGIVGAAAAVAVSSTLLVTVSPRVPAAVRSPELHAAVETASGGVALVASLLAYGRFSRRAQVRDLLQSVAFLIFGLTNLVLSAAPTILAESAPVAFDTWAALMTRLVGVALVAVSALMGPRTRRVRMAGWKVIGAVAASMTVIVAVANLVAHRLSRGGGPEVLTSLDLSAPFAHPEISAIQIARFVLYATAAWGFRRQARQGEGELATWLAAASVLGAAANLQFALYPSLYGDVVYSGDFLRGGFYGLVLVGAVREIGEHSRLLAVGAVLEERRRIARDLHDDVAQELAFIQSEVAGLRTRGVRAPELGRISGAARRAIDESRRAIAALSTGTDEPLGVLLRDLAAAVEARSGLRVEVDVDAGDDLPVRVREELLRIAREAINNAGSHSGAQRVDVTFRAEDPLLLTVRDDGSGFDVTAAEQVPGSFGLTGMRERVAALGGDLRIRSAPGHGTEVTAVVPRSAAAEVPDADG